MIVIDNFIKDKDFLKELINKKGELFKGTYGHKLYHHDQDWWEGYGKEKPKNIRQSLIQHIVDELNKYPESIDIDKIKGFEYWTHIHSNKETIILNDDEIGIEHKLEWHTNKDEWLHYSAGKFEYPIFSAVFWPIETNIDNGHLEISTVKQIDRDIKRKFKSCSKCEREIHNFEVERIKPVYNRLAIFDSSYWHKVDTVKRGIRWTFVLDGWDKKVNRRPKMEKE